MKQLLFVSFIILLLTSSCTSFRSFTRSTSAIDSTYIQTIADTTRLVVIKDDATQTTTSVQRTETGSTVDHSTDSSLVIEQVVEHIVTTFDTLSGHPIEQRIDRSTSRLQQMAVNHDTSSSYANYIDSIEMVMVDLRLTIDSLAARSSSLNAELRRYREAESNETKTGDAARSNFMVWVRSSQSVILIVIFLFAFLLYAWYKLRKII